MLGGIEGVLSGKNLFDHTIQGYYEYEKITKN